MNDNSEEILEQLTCPICFVYPEKEVFQCKNGHAICPSCIHQLENCPQCKIPFGRPQIRCRLMESLLNTVDIPCVNKDAGCTKRFLRKDLPYHENICGFRSVSLCKWMGYKCDFTASTVAPLIKHLELCHNARRWNSIVWDNFTTNSKFRLIYLQECDANSNPKSLDKTWFLILARLEADANKQNFLTFVPIHLHDGQNTGEYEVHLEIFNEICKRRMSSWSGFPSNYKHAEEDILYPSFRLTTNYIIRQGFKFCDLNKLSLSLRIRVNSFPSVNSPTKYYSLK